MKIEIDAREKLEQNADRYFALSKKARKKMVGLKEAALKLEHQLKSLQMETAKSKSAPLALKRKRDWFEKFRWFFTSDNLLVIGGRDAKSNEQIVNSFLDKGDLYFHADIMGAPHCALKTKDNRAPESSLREAAAFAVVFSRAWQSRAVLADAYWVLPEQVSKKAPSGESIGKGAFMIYGERQYEKKIPLECGIGLEKIGAGWRVISGPWSAVQKHAVHCVKLVPGKNEKGAFAKKLLAFFRHQVPDGQDSISLDEIIQVLPTGGSETVEQKGQNQKP